MPSQQDLSHLQMLPSPRIVQWKFVMRVRSGREEKKSTECFVLKKSVLELELEIDEIELELENDVFFKTDK